MLIIELGVVIILAKKRMSYRYLVACYLVSGAATPAMNGTVVVI